MKKILTLTLIALLCMTGCSLKKEKVEEKDKTNIYSEDSVSTKAVVSADNKLIVTIENNDTKTLDWINIDVAYFNEENELLKTSNGYAKNMMTGDISQSIIEMPTNSDNTPIEVSSIYVKVTSNSYQEKTVDIYKDKVTVTATADTTDTNKINVAVKNTSGVVLDELECAIMYYKGNEIVGGNTVFLTNVGESATSAVYAPMTTKDNMQEKVDYDKTVVFINNASKNKS